MTSKPEKLATKPKNEARAKDGRPQAPDDLTESQKLIWNQVVANEASSQFETEANRLLLKEFVRHAATAKFLATQIEAIEADGFQLDTEDFKAYIKLLGLRDQTSKSLSSIATKLRVSNQSRYTAKSAATAASSAGKASKPWDFSG